MIYDLRCVSTCGPATIQMNSFINYKISSKKLQCGTEKCKKMHIERPNEMTCPELHVDGWAEECVNSFETGSTELNDVFKGEEKLLTTEAEKYLGDIISQDGKNLKNIVSRKNKGTGLVNQIFATIVEMMPGKYLFEVSTILRNTILVSRLIFNSEPWYTLTKKK